MNQTKVYALIYTSIYSLIGHSKVVAVFLSKKEAEYACWKSRQKNTLTPGYHSVEEVDLRKEDLNEKEYVTKFVPEQEKALMDKRAALIKSKENKEQEVRNIEKEINELTN